MIPNRVRHYTWQLNTWLCGENCSFTKYGVEVTGRSVRPPELNQERLIVELTEQIIWEMMK